MKKSFLPLLFIFAIFSMSVRAQTVTPTVTIDDVVETPGTVYIPVYVDFSEIEGTNVEEMTICAVDFTINYNDQDDVLTFVGISDVGTGLDINNFQIPAEGDPPPIKIGWEGTGNGTDMEGMFITLEFQYTGGDSNIWFTDHNTIGETAIIDCTDATSLVTAEFNPGSITQAAPVPVSGWALMIAFGLMMTFVIFRIVRP